MKYLQRMIEFSPFRAAKFERFILLITTELNGITKRNFKTAFPALIDWIAWTHKWGLLIC